MFHLGQLTSNVVEIERAHQKPKASAQHIKRKLVSFVDQCHCLTQSAFLDACLCCFFVCLFVHFFAPVCIVQAYACLLVVSSLLTGTNWKEA